MTTLSQKQADKLAGKRLIAIRIQRWNTREHGHSPANDVVEIELEGGVVLRPFVSATDFGDYAVEMVRLGRRAK